MDENFYMKFPSVLREALLSSDVAFDDMPQISFASFKAYRGIFRKKDKPFIPLERSDFDSQAEKSVRISDNERRRNRRRMSDGIGFYSCSVYKELDEISAALRFPQDDRRIAQVQVAEQDGCIRCSHETSHVDWWLYENTSSFWKDCTLIE